MYAWLIGSAFATAPFQTGPLEPVPAEPTAVGVLDGQLLLLTKDQLFLRAESGWVDTGLPGGNAILVRENVGYVICSDEGVTRYTLEVEKISDTPCAAIAPIVGGFWIQAPDGIREVPGENAVPFEEQPDLLGGMEEEAWVKGNKLHRGSKTSLLFPGATGMALYTGANTPEWVFVHPQQSLIGVVGASGLESAWPQPFSPTSLAVGDLNGDGSDEIVVAGPSLWTYLQFPGQTKPAPPAQTSSLAIPARTTPTPAPVPRKRYVPPQRTSIAGFRIPNFGGLDPDPDYDGLFIGGFGFVVGDTVGTSRTVGGFSPGATGGIEHGGRRIRSYFGADTAPLFGWSGDSYSGFHLAMITAGVSVGSDRLRTGPFVTGGLLGAGAGLRAVFTPFKSRSGKLTGFEGRLTWFAPYTAHVSLYYVSAFPLGRKRNPRYERRTRGSFCHRFGFALGASGGFSSTQLAWEFVGRSQEYEISGSPAFALACESGGKSGGWFLGGETAPLFFYRVPAAGGGSDNMLRHYGSATLGAYFGGDVARIGPVMTAGVWTLGGGIRAVLTPFKTPKGAHHGLEIRALALYPAPALEAMALYHVWFNPRATRK